MSLTVEALERELTLIGVTCAGTYRQLAAGILPFIERHIAAGQQGATNPAAEAIQYHNAVGPIDAMAAEFSAMDNSDTALEEWPQRAIDALAFAGWAVVPYALPYEVLGEAGISGVFETGNPKHGWDWLVAKTRIGPHGPPAATPQPPKPAGEVPLPLPLPEAVASAYRKAMEAKGHSSWCVYPASHGDDEFVNLYTAEQLSAYGDAREAAAIKAMFCSAAPGACPHEVCACAGVKFPDPDDAGSADAGAAALASIAWVRHVRPSTDIYGGACVTMEWDEFNAMRVAAGLKPQKPSPKPLAEPAARAQSGDALHDAMERTIARSSPEAQAAIRGEGAARAQVDDLDSVMRERGLPNVSDALGHSRNFAAANPTLSQTTRDHIEGLCSMLEIAAAHPSPAHAGAGDAEALLHEVCQELVCVGCDPCTGSHAPMEDLHGRIADYFARRLAGGDHANS